MIDIGGLIFLLLIIAAFVGLIVLQVKLSKKEAVMPGLILPIISLVFALLIGTLFAMNVAITSSGATIVSDETGEYIFGECPDGYEVHHSDDCYNNGYIESSNIAVEENSSSIADVTLAFICVFSVCLIPGVVFIIIYFACHPSKKKLEKKAELDKMSINDL